MRTAVVTGGASGIGAAVVNRLRADGHRVAVIDLTPSEHDLAFTADVTSRDQLDAALTQIRDRLGPVTILVNAAGLDAFKRFCHISFAEWQRVIDGHSTAVSADVSSGQEELVIEEDPLIYTPLHTA